MDMFKADIFRMYLDMTEFILKTPANSHVGELLKVRYITTDSWLIPYAAGG